MSTRISIVVGAQWGDEGKGKITDFLSGDADYVVRFHGGNNAGHTVVLSDKRYRFHLLPSGVLRRNVISVIGNGVVVDPAVLLDELSYIAADTKLTADLLVSERAHVIMPYHIAMDAALTKHQGQLAAGSTGRGIAPACADKYYRHGIRMGDLLEPHILREKLERSFDFNSRILHTVFNSPFRLTFEEVFAVSLDHGQRLRPYITDTEYALSCAYASGKTVLYEGAQGVSLDPDHGLYPYTSSTNSVAAYASVGSGLGYNCRARIVGVAKPYLTRVGAGPLPSEMPPSLANQIRKAGDEFGTTTGRPRRVGWADLVQLRQAVRVNGITELAFTKLDILSALDRIELCVAYDIGDEHVDEMPANLSRIRVAKPVLKTFDGWPNITKQHFEKLAMVGYVALPQALRTYLEFIAEAVGCPISLLSYGADRKDTIVR